MGKKNPPHTRKTQYDFIPVTVGRSAYGIITACVCTLNGYVIDTEDKYNRDIKIWERSATAGFRQQDNYVNHGEYLYLAIQGQVEPSFWDQTKDDTKF